MAGNGSTLTFLAVVSTSYVVSFVVQQFGRVFLCMTNVAVCALLLLLQRASDKALERDCSGDDVLRKSRSISFLTVWTPRRAFLLSGRVVDYFLLYALRCC